MSQCGDSLLWARSDGSAAGGITATCLSLTMPSNVQNYQLISECSFNHTFGITSALKGGGAFLGCCLQVCRALPAASSVRR